MLNIPLTNIPRIPIIPTSHNVTKSKDPAYLVYNRVPKCGSSSVGAVIKNLKDANEYDMCGIPHLHALDDKEVKEGIRRMQSKNSRGKLIGTGHVYYVNYKKFNFNPILVNVVRDPVQRLISKEMPI